MTAVGEVDPRRHVGDYLRLERWEVPAPDGAEAPSVMWGRTPVDPNQRGPGGGLRAGTLLTCLDSLGGVTCGLAVLPQWIVTTSLTATVIELAHQGPLLLRSEVRRRGRNSVVTSLEVSDEGTAGRRVAAATMTCAVLDPGALTLEFERPMVVPMPPERPGAVGPVEFFAIEPGQGPVTRLHLEDRLRNPWGILHGGGIAVLADEAACRATVSAAPGPLAPDRVAASGAVLHYLRPARVGPVEARCRVLGSSAGRTVVRLTVHDLGADDRMVALGSVSVATL